MILTIIGVIVVLLLIGLKVLSGFISKKKEIKVSTADVELDHGEVKMLEKYFDNLANYFRSSFVKKYALRYFINCAVALEPLIDKRHDIDPRTIEFPFDNPTSLKKIKNLNSFLAEKLKTMGVELPEKLNFDDLHRGIVKALALRAHKNALEDIRPLLPETEEKRWKQLLAVTPTSLMI